MRQNSQESQWFDILTQANQIANSPDLGGLISRMVGLILSANHAEAAALFLYDRPSGPLSLRCTLGDSELVQSIHDSSELHRVLINTYSSERIPTVKLRMVKSQSKLYTSTNGRVHNLLQVPLRLDARQTGILHLLNAAQPELRLSQLMVDRLAAEIDKNMRIETGQLHTQRLEGLINIIQQITSTLDRGQILEQIIEYSGRLLNSEASSLFLIEDSGDLRLHLSTNKGDLGGIEVRIPAGKGIIGHAVQQGQTIIVNDASKDRRHYKKVDQKSGMVTRSILAVPLRTRTVNLGQQLGMTKERIIGGLEAMNKAESPFNEEDSRLLQTMANQAATVLEIAQLYSDSNQLFVNTISAMAAIIDAKDPNTVGHSQRVSEFSLEIARELSLPPEEIYHIRIGSLLHDIGKIGMPDAILRKPGALTHWEGEEIRKHPDIGEKILSQIHHLQRELPAVLEHHERLDGSGYPRGLRGNEISLIGRIVAVADIFDAITSDRPYRAAMDRDAAVKLLQAQSGVQLDAQCVDALIRALLGGKVKTQKDRETSLTQIGSYNANLGDPYFF